MGYAVGAAIAVVLLAGAWFLYQAWPRGPGSESADVNFMRDMVVHHDQAVTMSLTIRDRSDNESLRSIATDILLTQSTQIGMMRGSIERWGYYLVSEEPRMAWMGHPVEGLMPGMATAEEVALLSTLPVNEAQVLYCQLMIRHHAAGIEMAQAALERVDDPLAERLARAIIVGQTAEIEALQAVLAALGAAEEPVSPGVGNMDGMGDMDMGTPTAG